MGIKNKVIQGIFKFCMPSPAKNIIMEGAEHASGSLIKIAQKASPEALPLVTETAEKVVQKVTKIKPKNAKKAFTAVTNTVEKYTGKIEEDLLKQATMSTDEIMNATTATAKSIGKVVTKSNPFSIKLTDVLPKNSPYFKFSKETQKLFKTTCDEALSNAMRTNNPEKYISVLSNLKSLSTHVEEETVKVILKDKRLFNKYLSLINKLPQILGQKAMSTCPEIQTILTKLATMGTLNEKAFTKLMKSKEMQEILSGRLDIAYLKGINATAKIEENFVGKIIETTKQEAQKRLANAGIDTVATQKYFNAAERKILADSEYIERFVAQVERINNPEAINKILRQTKFDKNFLKYTERHFKNVLKQAELNPVVFNKALQIENRTLFGLSHTIQTISAKNTFKVSDSLFETFVKVQKKNPKHFSPLTFTSMNNFLHVSNGNEKLAKKILEQADKLGSTSVDFLFSRARKENIHIIEKCIAKGKFTAEDIFKIDKLAQYSNKISGDKLKKLYNDVYKPIYEALDVVDREIIAMKIVDIRLTRPGLYAKLESMKILELIKKRKINPRIIDDIARGDIKPEMISDMQKLLKGESLIKRYKSTKDALRHTISGDVVSIEGRLYINNNGKIDPWSMTEEKFNKLFPLVDRFAPIQDSHLNNKTLLSNFDELYRNPRTRAQYYKMFEQKGDDICVTIPAYKDILGEVRFTNREIAEQCGQASRAPSMQMIERTYARTMRPTETPVTEKNPFASTDLNITRKKTYAPTG